MTSIDGEIDLKKRSCVPDTVDCKVAHYVDPMFTPTIECPPPDASVYSFDANILFSKDTLAKMPAPGLQSRPGTAGKQPSDPAEKKRSLTAINMLLQGTHLRNTYAVYGVAVYTGNETKLGMNKHLPHTKWTKIDLAIQRLSRMVFCLQFIIVVIFGILGVAAVPSYVLRAHHSTGDADLPSDEYIMNPLRMLLLMSFMIPISLKVSLDICKIIYAKFIDWDLEMTDSTGTHANVANTSITEDLGQMEFVFSDKTGTLTENIMAFKKCSIGGSIFGHEDEEIADGPHSSGSFDAKSDRRLRRLMNRAKVKVQGHPTHARASRTHGASAIESASVEKSPVSTPVVSTPKRGSKRLSIIDPETDTLGSDCLDFFRAIALCNTVTPVAKAFATHGDAVASGVEAEVPQPTSKSERTPRARDVEQGTPFQARRHSEVLKTKGEVSQHHILQELDPEDRLRGSVGAHRRDAAVSEVARGSNASLSGGQRKNFLVARANRGSAFLTGPEGLLAGNQQDGLKNASLLSYKGASPDEEALVEAAADMGVVLRKRRDDNVLLELTQPLLDAESPRRPIPSIGSMSRIHEHSSSESQPAVPSVSKQNLLDAIEAGALIRIEEAVAVAAMSGTSNGGTVALQAVQEHKTSGRPTSQVQWSRSIGNLSTIRSASQDILAPQQASPGGNSPQKPSHKRRKSMEIAIPLSERDPFGQVALMTKDGRMTSVNNITFPGTGGDNNFPATVHSSASGGTGARPKSMHDYGLLEWYKVLHVFSFSSERKRMSVLVQEIADPVETIAEEVSSNVAGQSMRTRLRLITKGADDVMIPICGLAAPEPPTYPAGMANSTHKHLEVFAGQGLRTMLIGHRDISEAEYSDWLPRYEDANTALTDRDAKLATLWAELEQKMHLLGVSAVEDKLQEDVPQTINVLRKAGCRVWMLTGDKRSTAIQIGSTCGLIPVSVAGEVQANVVSLDGTGLSESQLNSQVLKAYEDQLLLRHTIPVSDLEAKSSGKNVSPLSVVVDGETLQKITRKRQKWLTKKKMHGRWTAGWFRKKLTTYFLDMFTLQTGPSGQVFNPAGGIPADRPTHESFVDLCLLAETVICCRVTPRQKEEVVELIKERQYMTLAVGDGGNDVSMIQQAHVGVGIRGREGFQAARSADYRYSIRVNNAFNRSQHYEVQALATTHVGARTRCTQKNSFDCAVLLLQVLHSRYSANCVPNLLLFFWDCVTE